MPILFITSASQETVTWSAYPHAIEGAGLGHYRRDHDDNPGDHYEPRNELFGISWEMMSGHFDMLPRDYQFVADWLDAVAAARLPDRAGDPLKDLMLRDGWLIDARVPAAGELPEGLPDPRAISRYKGHRNQALWYPERGARADGVRDRPGRAAQADRAVHVSRPERPADQSGALSHGDDARPAARCCTTTDCSR